MRKLIIISSIIYTCLFVNAQNIYFSKLYDFYGVWEVGWNIQKVDSGYFVVGGAGDSITGIGRIAILFIDTAGNEIWKKSYGVNGDPYCGRAGSFVPVKEGGFALGGSIDHPGGDSDVMLWRFKQNGDTLWTKIFKDTNSYAYANNCIQTRDNGFALVAYSNAGGNTAMLMKTDTIGNEEWTKIYSAVSIRSVDTCIDGGFILGSYQKPGGLNVPYVIKTDSAGSLQWDNTFGGPYDDGSAVVEALSGDGYIIACDSTYAEHPSSYLDYDYIYLIRLDSSGNIEWQKTYKHGGIDVWVSMVRELSDGNFIITGSIPHQDFSRIGFLLKTSSQGDSLWYRYYRPFFIPLPAVIDHYLLDVQPTNDGGFIASGFKKGMGKQDMLVIKVNCLGFESPPQPYFSYNIIYSDSFIVTLFNKSMYSDSVTISFGDGDTVISANPKHLTLSDTVIYITHTYPETGVYIVNFVGTACGDTNIFTDTIFICSTLQTNFTFIQDSNTVIFANQSQYNVNYIWYFGDGDTSIVKNPVHTYTDTGLYIVTLVETSCGDTGIFIDTIYVLPGSGINELQVSGFKLQIFPNPFSDYTTIEAYVPENVNNAEIVIYNLLGIVIKMYELEQGYNAITILKDDIASGGIYFYALKCDGRLLEKKKMVIIK